MNDNDNDKNDNANRCVVYTLVYSIQSVNNIPNADCPVALQ